MLFIYLAVLVILLSWIMSLVGVTVEEPTSGETVAIESLISGDGLEYMLTSAVDNFVQFPPLGTVLTIVLGVGLAQQTGLLEAAMKRLMTSAPRRLITWAVVFVGIIGNLAADAAFIIIPPLAALAFLAVRRHPLAGLAAGFAATGAGYAANLFITSNDALASGISTKAVELVAEDVVVSPISNWYFMVASVPLLVVVGVLITERVVEPRLGRYEGEARADSMEELSGRENRGLRNALLTAVLYFVLLFAAVFPAGSPLRNEEGGLVPSPLLSGVVPLIFLFFVVVAVVYGLTVGVISSSADVPKLMAEAISRMAGFIVLVFAAAQFLAYFGYSNLGLWISVNGAALLENIGLTGVSALIGFIVVTTALAFVIFSTSGLWALMAPIFVPLFYFLDYNPAYVQAAYRIADSSTNVLTPLNPYVPLVLGFIQTYDPSAKLGTLLSLMLPYTIAFLIVWTAFFLIWALIGLPVGPGESLYVSP